MTARAPRPPTRAQPAADSPRQPRTRDAARTRQLLLDAARRRFAEDGYSATTVRDIAEDAGVNVALISRYFSSKEGLFEACLTVAVDDFRRTSGYASLDRIPAAIAVQTIGLSAAGPSNQLALLLRSSGDQRADEIRLGVLRSAAEQLARVAGWQPGQPDGDRLLLRAQVVLATSIGIVILRSSLRLEPLTSAGEEDLLAPLHDVVHALLSNPKGTVR